MYVKFREKSQVTLPREAVMRMGLKVGDILECTLDESGGLLIVPAGTFKNPGKKI